MAGHVTVVVTPDSRTQVLRLMGELDIATVEACRAELDAALADEQPRQAPDGEGGPPRSRVVLDLSAVTFLSVAGIHMLSDTARSLSQHQVAVVLAVPRGQFLDRVVRLAGLDGEMGVVDGPFPIRAAARRPPSDRSASRSSAARSR